MKIVVNKQYGGFSLSPEGIDALLERKGLGSFHYQNVYKSGHIDFHAYERLKTGDKKNMSMFVTVTKDLGDNPTEEEVYNDHIYFKTRDIHRADPDLVAVVETLGDKASGDYAALEVIEIPDDVEWQIEEYDGMEWVAEKHRTWS